MAVSERILVPAQEEAVKKVRSALQDLQRVLSHVSIEPDDEKTLYDSLRQLDDFFLLVVVGEFNAGKSALINALLGERILAEGATPTTTEIQLLRHVDQEAAAPSEDSIRNVAAGADFLKDLHLVDTPGTNAIAREHEILTQQFVPRADLVLFVTSADRPLTETEHQFLERIQEWGKKVVMVINKADILTEPSDLEKVSKYVLDNVHELLGFSPELFPVSARKALQAKKDQDKDELRQSGFFALEDYVRTKLTDAERFRLKLLSPLGVGLRFLEKYSAQLAKRSEILQEDLATVRDIRIQLAGYKQEMMRGFQLRLSDVDNLLHRFEKRGNEFFEETLRLARVFDLMNKSKIQGDFERHVVGDLPHKIEHRVEDIIDWLVSSDLQQWQTVRDYLVARRSEHSERVAGRLPSGFDYDRARLLDSVGKAAQQTLEDHDQRGEAARLARSVQMAVANAALLEVGAVGLGTAVSLIASSTATDVTGIVAASALAAVGLFVIPRRRYKAKRELQQRISGLRDKLIEALKPQFEKEIDRSTRRIEDAIAPYVQFVEGEWQTLRQKQEQMAQLNTRLAKLKAEIASS